MTRLLPYLRWNRQQDRGIRRPPPRHLNRSEKRQGGPHAEGKWTYCVIGELGGGSGKLDQLIDLGL